MDSRSHMAIDIRNYMSVANSKHEETEYIYIIRYEHNIPVSNYAHVETGMLMFISNDIYVFGFFVFAICNRHTVTNIYRHV